MFDYSNVIPSAVAEMKPSGIRKYFGIMETLPDAISLGVGEPDFITPRHVMQAGIDSLLAGKTQYTANSGLIQLRREISKYLEKSFEISYDPESEVLVTVGGSEAIDLCLRAFLTVGDEILIPEPAFVCYGPLASLTGAKPVPIVTKKEDSFKLTPEALKAAITPKSKVLILSYPNNPTGGVMKKEELEAIAEVIKDTNILVITDEIYAELSYGFKHTLRFDRGHARAHRCRQRLLQGFRHDRLETGLLLRSQGAHALCRPDPSVCPHVRFDPRAVCRHRGSSERSARYKTHVRGI